MILTEQQRLSISDEIVRDLNSLKGTNLNTSVMSISANTILKSPTADFSTQAMLMSTDNRICVDVIRKHQAYIAWADNQTDPLLGGYHVDNSAFIDAAPNINLYFKVTPNTNYPLASFNVRLEYTNINVPYDRTSMIYDNVTGLGYLNDVFKNPAMPSGELSIILSRNGADIGLLKLQIVYGGSSSFPGTYANAEYVVYSPFIPTQVPPEAYV